MQSGEVAGRICNSALHYKSQLEALGFVDVVEVIHKWPQNRWPKDKYYKELGISYCCLMYSILLTGDRDVES